MGSTYLILLNIILLSYNMKVSSALKAMKGATPQLLTASKDSMMAVNTEAFNQFTKVFSPLTNRQVVLDFGCMSGETTNAIARGELGNLGKPESVIGTNVSVMTDHCKSAYTTPNLSWKHCDDVESKDWQKFCQKENKGDIDLITSFHYLQEVENQPKTIQMFNKMLTDKGKFCFFVKSTQNLETNALRREFENMKADPEWSKMLSKVSYPYFGTEHKNNSWMTTVDSKGKGAVTDSDFIKLMEANGFEVAFTENKTVSLTFSEDFIRNYFKTIIKPALTEMQVKEKELFLEEYVRRVRSQRTLNSDGNYLIDVDGFVIMGEKQKDVQ